MPPRPSARPVEACRRPMRRIWRPRSGPDRPGARSWWAARNPASTMARCADNSLATTRHPSRPARAPRRSCRGRTAGVRVNRLVPQRNSRTLAGGPGAALGHGSGRLVIANHSQQGRNSAYGRGKAGAVRAGGPPLGGKRIQLDRSGARITGRPGAANSFVAQQDWRQDNAPSDIRSLAMTHPRRRGHSGGGRPLGVPAQTTTFWRRPRVGSVSLARLVSARSTRAIRAAASS